MTKKTKKMKKNGLNITLVEEPETKTTKIKPPTKNKTRLDQKYTWQQLCDRTLTKIQQGLKPGEHNKFKQWFMERETLGYLFDYQLILRCYKIWKELHNNRPLHSIKRKRRIRKKHTIIPNSKLDRPNIRDQKHKL